MWRLIVLIYLFGGQIKSQTHQIWPCPNDASLEWSLDSFVQSIEGHKIHYSFRVLFPDTGAKVLSDTGVSLHYLNAASQTFDPGSVVSPDFAFDFYNTNQIADHYLSHYANYLLDSISIKCRFDWAQRDSTTIDTLFIFQINGNSGLIEIAPLVNGADTVNYFALLKRKLGAAVPDVLSASAGFALDTVLLGINDTGRNIRINSIIDSHIFPVSHPLDGKDRKLFAIALHYKPGGVYSMGDTIVHQSYSGVPLSNPLNLFGIYGIEEFQGELPIGLRIKNFQMAGLVDADNRFDSVGIELGFNPSFSFGKGFNFEHVDLSWYLKPPAAIYSQADPSFCVDAIENASVYVEKIGACMGNLNFCDSTEIYCTVNYESLFKNCFGEGDTLNWNFTYPVKSVGYIFEWFPTWPMDNFFFDKWGSKGSRVEVLVHSAGDTCTIVDTEWSAFHSFIEGRFASNLMYFHNRENNELKLIGAENQIEWLSLFNVQGQGIRIETGEIETIRIGQLPAGFYILQWLSKDGAKGVLRFAKQ